MEGGGSVIVSICIPLYNKKRAVLNSTEYNEYR